MPDRDDFLQISKPGSVVWELLATPRTVDELLEELLDRFDAAGGELARDVPELLDRLVECGAVEAIDESDG